MASNIYSVGLNNVGSYQVSGRPYCATGSLLEGTESIDFPMITKEILVLNLSGSNDLDVYFHTGSMDSNKYTISGGEQYTFSVKCKEVFLSASSGTDYSLYASLTQITSSHMFHMTGSGVTE